MKVKVLESVQYPQHTPQDFDTSVTISYYSVNCSVILPVKVYFPTCRMKSFRFSQANWQALNSESFYLIVLA